MRPLTEIKKSPQRSNIYHKILESVTSNSKNGLLANVRQRITYEQNREERIMLSFSSSSDSDDSSSTEESSITSSDRGTQTYDPGYHKRSRKKPTAEPYVGKLERLTLCQKESVATIETPANYILCCCILIDYYFTLAKKI